MRVHIMHVVLRILKCLSVSKQRVEVKGPGICETYEKDRRFAASVKRPLYVETWAKGGPSVFW